MLVREEKAAVGGEGPEPSSSASVLAPLSWDAQLCEGHLKLI